MDHFMDELGLLAVGSRFRVVSEQLMSFVKGFYKEYDFEFEPRWFTFFHLVQQNPAIHMIEAANQLGVTHVTIHSICKVMVDKGLLEMRACTKDARAKQLKLTQRGEVLFTRLEPAWFALKHALENVFSEQETKQIMHILHRLDEVAQDKEIERHLKASMKPESLLKRLTILPYNPENADHKRYFTALNIEWLEEYFEVEPLDQQMFDDPEGMILEQGGMIFIAKIDEQIVGVGALIKHSDTMIEFAKMAISKPFQGKGIGKKMVEVFMVEAKRQKFEKLFVVSSTLLPSAVPMYRRMGFVDSEEAIHKRYKRGNITLEKRLV